MSRSDRMFEIIQLLRRAERPMTAQTLADAGYRSEATFQTLEARGITAYISLGHEARPAKPPNPAHGASHRMADRLTSAARRASGVCVRRRGGCGSEAVRGFAFRPLAPSLGARLVAARVMILLERYD